MGTAEAIGTAVSPRLWRGDREVANVALPALAGGAHGGQGPACKQVVLTVDQGEPGRADRTPTRHRHATRCGPRSRPCRW